MKQYFFCYDKKLLKFLKRDRSLSYICHGIHPKTWKDFYLFPITDELDNALQEYSDKNGTV